MSYDKLVLSDDPGAIIDANGELINFNRQLISTQAGLREASREYAVKFRADFLLGDGRFCSLPLQPCSGYFESKIRMTNLFVQNPLKMPFLFHLSDLVHFGRRVDLQNFWSIPTLSREQAVNLNAASEFKKWTYAGGSIQRMRAEQALPLGFLKTQGIDLPMSHPNQFDRSRYELFEKFLLENFEITEWQQSGVIFPARMMDSFLETVMTSQDLAKITANASDSAARFKKADLRRRYLFVFNRAYLFHLKKSLVFSYPKLKSFFSSIKSVQRLFFGSSLSSAAAARKHLESLSSNRKNEP